MIFDKIIEDFVEMQNTKIIKIYSHQLGSNFTCQNGDVYDSALEVYQGTKKIFQTNFVNVDSSENTSFHGKKYNVEMVNGIYDAIIGKHRYKYNAPFIIKENTCQDLSNWEQLLDDSYLLQNSNARTLNSIYPNPNWNNQKICVGINIHRGGIDWDYSAGCITIYWAEYDKFIKLFELNERVKIFKI